MVVPVYWRRNGTDDFINDVWLVFLGFNLLNFVFSQLGRDYFINTLDEIYLHVGLKDREPVFYIQTKIKLVLIYTSNIHFVSRLSRINIVPQNYNIDVSRNPSRRDRSGSLLNLHFLEVPVHCFLFDDSIRSLWLAKVAIRNFNLVIFNLLNRPHLITAGPAFVVNDVELWKYLRPPSYHPLKSN